MLVDSHVHMWKLGGELDYSWVNGTPLERSFVIDDLKQEAGNHVPDKIVFVEAGCPPQQGIKEAEWVAATAESEPRIQAIVASAPLEQGEAVRGHLEALAAIPLVKGVRRLIQSEGPGFATQPDFVKGVQMLADFGLSFDICILHPQMGDAIELVRQCPNVSFILDHIGKPGIKDGLLDPWREEIRTLAGFPNVYCKISGMVTEANHQSWTRDDLKPYIDHVIDVFGTERVAFGGDWPVFTLATDYPRWVQTLQWATESLSDDEKQKLFGQNALQFYRM